MGINFYILLIILSFTPSFFWLLFYFYYSPRFTTPRRLLIALFFLGMAAAILAVLIERGIFQILPDSILKTFERYFFGIPPYQLRDVLIIFFLMFFLVAPIEEIIKFLMIRIVINKKPQYLNQIIDGIKLGVVTGLGFAVIENGIYFLQPLSVNDVSLLWRLFLLRFFVSTLGHSLYTGIMGYYFGLSNFYKLYSRRFLREGILLAIFVHAIFNFFLLINLGFFSITVLIIFLLLMFKWYQDRRNLENYIIKGQLGFIHPPLFSERSEFESILAKNKVTYEFIKKLNLCPFCLRKQDPKQDICSYCGGKLKREK